MRTKSERQWGFDHTGFGEGETGKQTFLAILKECEISPKPIHDKDGKAFIFANPYVMLVTANNPITGKYGDPKRREPELGYASYIGIEGSPQLVEKIANLIRKKADFIKEEVKHERQFI